MGSTPRARGRRHRAVPRCTGPTWEANCRLGRSPAPVISEQHQHGLLALVVVLAGCKLQRGGLKRAPSQALDCHQQTLVAAFIFSPVTNLGNQAGVTTVPPARTGAAVESPWQAPGQQTQALPAVGWHQPGTPVATLCPPAPDLPQQHRKGLSCSRAVTQGTRRQELAPASTAEQWDWGGWSSPLGLLRHSDPPPKG